MANKTSAQEMYEIIKAIFEDENYFYLNIANRASVELLIDEMELPRSPGETQEG